MIFPPTRKYEIRFFIILRYNLSFETQIRTSKNPCQMMFGAKANKTGAGKIRMSKSATISPEINLIGKTTDEAIALLDKYLDDAYLSHLDSVRIVHGKGTGALRNAVHTYLKRQKHVKSYHLGEYGEGDAGVTIAEFK